MRVGGSAGKGGPRDDGVIGLEPVPRNMAPTKSRSAATVHLGDRAAVPQNGAGSTGSRKRPKEHRMTAMEYFAGLDVAVKTTAVCVVDSTGSVVLETTVATEPEAIGCALEGYADRLRRVG